MSRYSDEFKDESVKIKHILSHTSQGTPGERFQYSGNRYDRLTAVLEKKHGKPFLDVIVATFFEPLGMSGSVPYHDVVVDEARWRPSLGGDAAAPRSGRAHFGTHWPSKHSQTTAG